ncbi:MAG TPA: helix-turn-helix domain-containing protein [Candidatus Binatia bacterium]|jgi:AcrR family transcriptional regulator
MSQGESTGRDLPTPAGAAGSPGRRRPGRSGPAKPAGSRDAGGRPEPGVARQALLDAARAEFDEAGFEGTDTNRIARRAGYAPQTFYRHFRDKTEIFVEIYKRWFDDEWRDLENAQAKGAEGAARVTLAHHARHREFRRSLRRLTVTDPVVRTARAESRRRQVALLAAEDAARGRERSDATRIALLLAVERIADAAADGELHDLGVTHEQEVAMLADVIRRFAR